MILDDWSKASVSQGMPKMADKSPDARKRHGADSLLLSSGGTNPAKTLISDLLVSRQYISVILSLPVCSNLLRQL